MLEYQGQIIHYAFNLTNIKYAGMAELADALDLGSSVPDVQVRLLLPAPLKGLLM